MCVCGQGIHGALCPGLKGYVGVHGVLCPGLHSFVGPCWAHSYVLQEINPRWLQMKKCLQMKNGVESKTPGKSQFCDRRNRVFAESIEKRGSTYEHVPLCGSARAAI